MPGFYYTTGDGNTFRDFGDDDLYNYGPLNYYQRPDTRYTLGAMGHYEVAEYADVYTQLMFSDYESTAQIAPGGAFGETGTVNCDNPLMSAQQLAAIGCSIAPPTPIRRRRPPTGERRAGALLHPAAQRRGRRSPGHLQHRLVPRRARRPRRDHENWAYDASAQYSKVKVDNYTLNRFVLPRFQNAIHAVERIRTTGDRSCAPPGRWPPMQAAYPTTCSTFGAVNPCRCAHYLQAPSLEVGRIEQEIYGGSVTGDLGGHRAREPARQRQHQGGVRLRDADGPSGARYPMPICRPGS